MGATAFQRMRREAAERADLEAKEVEQDGEAGAGAGAGAAGAAGTTGAEAGGEVGNGGSNAGAGDGNTEKTGEGDKPDSAGMGGVNTPERLTHEQYGNVMKNKTNVMAALKEYGQEFSDRDAADTLRDQLNGFLAAKGLLPDGI